MASFAEKILKQRIANTGYGRAQPPQQPTQSSSQNRTAQSTSPRQDSSRSAVPPGEPPSDDSIDLTPDGLIVRRRRPRNPQPPMGDLDINLNISAPVNNRN